MTTGYRQKYLGINALWIAFVSMGCSHFQGGSPWPQHLRLSNPSAHARCQPALSLFAVGSGLSQTTAREAAQTQLIQQIATEIRIVVQEASSRSAQDGDEIVTHEFAQSVERQASFSHSELIEVMDSQQRGKDVRVLVCLQRRRAERALDQAIERHAEALQAAVTKTRERLGSPKKAASPEPKGLLRKGLGIARKGMDGLGKEVRGIRARSVFKEVKNHYAALNPLFLQYRGIVGRAHPREDGSHRRVASLTTEFEGSSLLNSLFDQGLAHWARIWAAKNPPKTTQ